MHKNYTSLYKNGISQSLVCHKYEFINKTNGVNSQAIETFHYEFKLVIKKEKEKNRVKAIFKRVLFYFHCIIV
ncbi:hypothetical protein H311_03738, partial [Anncaliia algerae PRA109]